ncbi:LOW QUALITY PROTEIN: D(3) dopamine receptor, partial [Vipera latastei]
LVIVLGNVLVCLAVLRERNLQTTTYYLVVSLAIADLLVAILVMPWVIYLERKESTQMLAIVLGTFIVCWLPFFVTHILNCQVCHVSPELYSAITWLGYINSALNPIIYITSNNEFRKAFLKIL